ncbi:MAG TPA: hypothetical protein PLS03_05855, partial [Terrimicrobiaceae bacterium]|nr:hypothetical protein [Terrimicrobiaceae bacterium]
NLKAIFLTFDGKGIADGFLREPGKDLFTPPITMKNETLVNVGNVTGTYLKFVDAKLDKVRLNAGKETVLAWFKNCRFTDTSLNYEAGGPPVLFWINGAQGTLEEKGAGMDRRKAVEKVAQGTASAP